MSFFKRANRTSYIEYQTPDGEGYIRLRDELAKEEVNGLYISSPTDEADRRGTISFSEKLMELLIVGWSFVDENGNEVPFSILEYRQLDASGTAFIERTVNDHFRAITGAEVEEMEKKQ